MKEEKKLVILNNHLKVAPRCTDTNLLLTPAVIVVSASS